MLSAQKKKSLRSGPKIINEATRLFSGLADLDFESGYNNHIYFQYLSNNKNDISLLGTYHSKVIFDKYIVRVSGKGFTVVDHPSEVYGFPDTHECIDGNLPLRLVLDIDARQNSDPMNPELPFLDKYKISREDLLYRNKPGLCHLHFVWIVHRFIITDNRLAGIKCRHKLFLGGLRCFFDCTFR